jgi:mono/diheme cytochrome c family protein
MPPADRSWRLLRRALGFAGGAAVLTALAGCEVKEGQPDLVNGKKLFVQKCGSCHMLARANTNGTIGPNLDESFHRAIEDGFRRSTIAGVVKMQILNPRIDSQMPSKLVTGDNAEDVAAYVAVSAAKPGTDTGPLALGPTSGPGALFVQQGCGSCHKLSAAQSSGTTGPDLDEALKGKSAAEIREAIVNPDAEVAPGFQPGVMPKDYGQKLNEQQLDQLADWLAKMAR